MPGQRKRGRSRERQRGPSDTELGPGRWAVVFETADEARWRTEVRRRIAEHEVKDPSMFRLDTFRGRSRLPTTYRLSVFVPAPPDP
ncbi:hypothetical protein ACIBBB_15970 [Streptomyces sp. NPDC051217]|uniref:hypothetical protein n=1 Tax=Streptomyces sp. NPDC051217 TaxID=3365644 RepID=UPI00379407F0